MFPLNRAAGVPPRPAFRHILHRQVTIQCTAQHRTLSSPPIVWSSCRAQVQTSLFTSMWRFPIHECAVHRHSSRDKSAPCSVAASLLLFYGSCFNWLARGACSCCLQVVDATLYWSSSYFTAGSVHCGLLCSVVLQKIAL